LKGVQGTQVITPEQARAAGLVREDTVTLVIGSDRHRVGKRTTTLGRSRDCDIIIADANASRVHAEIRHVGSEFLLVDHKSTNGTRVNGKRIGRHQLSDGDVIEVGTTQIAVERS
jgi:pSer/pThr/pTyr-binding forkhead associated (FHA) protein